MNLAALKTLEDCATAIFNNPVSIILCRHFDDILALTANEKDEDCVRLRNAANAYYNGSQSKELRRALEAELITARSIIKREKP